MKMNKSITIIITALILASCGSGSDSKEQNTFYKKENISTKKLELSIEASGIIEAISSVEF